jgi:hypothetical protein
MNKKNWYLGAAVLGVLLTVSFTAPAFARVLGRMYANSLHVENEPRANTSGRFTLGNDDAYIKGKLEVDGSVYLDGQNYSVVPATQTVAASFTITADACGGLKRIDSAGDVTSDTTNTISAPSSSNAGCRMLIVNVGTKTIYLDSNALFGVTSAASLPIGPKGSVSVWSDGSVWWHGAWTEY